MGEICQPLFAACPSSLLRLFFLWRSKLVDREQGRYAQKASAGKESAQEILSCFRKVRRAYRAPGRAPLHRNNPVLARRMACPPAPENEGRLMVFARNALASGPGNACNSTDLSPTCRKVKVYKLFAACPQPFLGVVGLQAGGIRIIKLGKIIRPCLSPA
jgi:hypothetical protein